MERSTAYARAYERRALATEAEAADRRVALRDRARRMSACLKDRFGTDVRVYLFGSSVDSSTRIIPGDIDLAVQGLDAASFWEAWAILEPLSGDASLDLVRLERVRPDLRETILTRGEELP